MRIISKYKDYYDYYAGIFGIDKTKIYKRKKVTIWDKESSSVFDTDIHELRFAIGGTLYTMFRYNNKLYHTPEELEDLEKIRIDYNKNVKYFRSRISQFISREFNHLSKNKFQTFYYSVNGIDIDVNRKKREPVLLQIDICGYSRDDRDWNVPLLKSYEFYRVLDAKDVYIKVETFLGWLVDNPPLPDTQTNIGKIESKGFDSKRSFRPNMK